MKKFLENAMACVLFLLLSFLSGCALQATMVDLETDLDTLKKHQQVLQQRLEGAEKALRERPAPKAQTDLTSRLDGLASDSQNLSGKFEETAHLLDALTHKIDDAASRMQEAIARLDSLDARITSLERLAAREQPPEGETKSILPGRSLDGTSKAAGITPTEAYNLAYNDYLKGNYDLAIMGFQNFLQQYPSSSRTPHVFYWMGEAFYAKKDYAKAIEWFDRGVQEFPRSEKAGSSLLKKAFTYQDQGKREQAKETFKKVVEQFPFTSEAELAKNRLAEMR